MIAHFNHMEKKCFKCGEVKLLGDFYKHPQMADGHLNKCKDCNKKDVQKNYRDRKPQYQEYYREREHTERRKTLRAKYGKNYAAKDPLRRIANTAVGNAIRRGRITRIPCEVCGNPKSEAHHEDYSKPLEVRWLCFAHHRAEHGQQVLTE